MANVGYATLQIIPSVRGIGDELRRQLVAPAAQAGEAAGEAGGGGFQEAFKGALAALGVEALAEKAGELFSEAFNEAVEQANITSKLQAQLGASDADAAKYGRVVGKLYSKGVTESFEQGAEAVRSIVNAGLVDPTATNRQLQSIATEMTDVANTFGTEIGLQTQAVSALMKNGLAPDAKSALDVITYGLQKLGPNAEDLLETFQEYPVQLKKLGLDAETSLGLFRQGLQGGARDTDIIADALKEFSIRAIDGSATTSAGYKLLGLSVKKTSEQVAKGGDSAASALDIVLDRLRSVPDPVKRAAAATDLFGAQSEDLGAALFKLDPSSAVDGLGRFTGAADQLGKDLRSGPSYEIQLFKRTVQQGLVTFIGGQVLPILAKWGATFDTDVLPPLSLVGGVLAASFLPTLSALITVGKGTVNWTRTWGIWLAPLAILIGGITLALNAEAIATGAVTAVFSLYRSAILLGTAVTEGFTGAQAALNAVMELNPITLVVIALVALAAAVFIAWKRSDTFRAVVMAAWLGIQTAALVAWRTVLQPTINGLVLGWQAVAAGALWLWRTVLAPTFSVIGTAAQILATIIGVVLYVAFEVWWTGVQLYTGLVMVGLRAVAAVGVWLWSTVFSPVVHLLVGGFQLWWIGVKLYAGLVTTGLRGAGAVGLWLWHAVFSPVLGWIVGGFKFWWSGVLLYVGLAKASLYGLGTAAMWVYQHAISPALHGMAAVAQWLYDKGLKPPLDKGAQLAKSMGQAFVTAKNTISTEWSKLEGIAKKPISFIISTVYNKGLVGVWNKVASAFGAPKLGLFKGFARGGVAEGVRPGYTPGRDTHLIAVGGGEAIMRPEWTRAMGPGYVNAMNALAARGGVSAVQRAAGLPGFKKGGIFGWVGSAANAVAGVGSTAWNGVKAGAGWLTDTIAASARAGVRAVVNPLLAQIPGLDTGWGRMAKKVPEHMIDVLFGYADKADAKGASTAFGGGTIPSGQHAAVIRAALTAAGAPPPGTMAQWLSGMNTLITRESGWNAGAVNRTDANAKAGHPSQGLAQTIPSTWAAYVPTSLRGRGILDPVANVAAAIRYIISRYGNITAVQQADASKPPKGYAVGTTGAARGWAWVGERGPELVRFGGGETVLNHADSLRAASLATAGYAKGTARLTAGQKSARKQVPGDLGAFTRSLTGSASDISSAAKGLAADLKAAGGAGKRLASSTGAASVRLQALSKQRDALAAKVTAAKQYASDQKGMAADVYGLSALSGAGTVQDLINQMGAGERQVRTFKADVASLSKRGLSKGLLGQLDGLGPSSPLAQVLSGATPLQIKQLNSLAKAGSSLATSYGNGVADMMYDSGKDASKGFLRGLQDEEKVLQAEMTKIGTGLVRSVRHSLDSHSPARKLIAVGHDAGDGLVIGLDHRARAVAAAAARLGAAATPAAPAPAFGQAAAHQQIAQALAGMQVHVQVGGEPIAAVARTEVRRANGELIAVLNAGGGQ
jgi:SLT domain-containing protein